MLFHPSEVKKIAVFRALQLGDMLCSIPAIRALRKAYPEAEITLIGLPWAESLLSRFNRYFDSFIPFAGYPGLPEQEFHPEGFVRFLQTVIQKKFDLVLQMQGNGNLVNPMIELLGSKYSAGFFKEGLYVPKNGSFIEYPDTLHEIERHLKLVDSLRIPLQGTDLEFPLTETDVQSLKALKLPLSDKSYICIHTGSRSLERRWPAEYFAKLADLVADHGLTPVLTGTQEELDTVEKVAGSMKKKAVIAAGRTGLGAAAVLIQQSSGLISNCTGVAHIAAALKVPSVVISLNGEAFRWNPLNNDLHYSVDWTKTPVFDLVYQRVLQLLNRYSTNTHYQSSNF